MIAVYCEEPKLTSNTKDTFQAKYVNYLQSKIKTTLQTQLVLLITVRHINAQPRKTKQSTQQALHLVLLARARTQAQLPLSCQQHKRKESTPLLLSTGRPAAQCDLKRCSWSSVILAPFSTLRSFGTLTPNGLWAMPMSAIPSMFCRPWTTSRLRGVRVRSCGGILTLTYVIPG